MSGRTALRIVIVLAAVALGFVLVRQVDAKYTSLGMTSTRRNDYDRMRNYNRMRSGLTWIAVAATLGVAGVLVTDPRSWRRPWSPGAITTAAATFTTVAVIALHLLTATPMSRAHGDFLDMGGQLDTLVPSAVIGAWATLALAPRRRRRDPLELAGLLVGGLWMTVVAALIGYGVIFG